MNVRAVTLPFLAALVLAACDDSAPKDMEQTTDNAFVSCGELATLSTGSHTLTVDGKQRTFHVRVPPRIDADALPPLVMGYHGTDGSSAWFIGDALYALESVVGDGALLVYPDALPGPDGKAQWQTESELTVFDAILAQLQGCFDPSRVFVTGHSSGGGMAHALGCARGNVVRAIAPVAGMLVQSECVGEVAVMQMHGAKDTLVPVSNGLPTRDYWANRNGCDVNKVSPQQSSQCELYAGCDEAFDVQWCPFEQPIPERGTGHEWPVEGGKVIWDFFSSLPTSEPGAAEPDPQTPIPTGSARLRFALRYPDRLIGMPERAAASLYAADTTQPLVGAPLHLIDLDFPVGDYAAGSDTKYEIDVDLSNVQAGRYTLAVNVYIAGGTYPIPQAGHDYVALAPIVIEEGRNEWVFEDPLTLELLIAPPAQM